MVAVAAVEVAVNANARGSYYGDNACGDNSDDGNKARAALVASAAAVVTAKSLDGQILQLFSHLQIANWQLAMLWQWLFLNISFS